MKKLAYLMAACTLALAGCSDDDTGSQNNPVGPDASARDTSARDTSARDTPEPDARTDDSGGVDAEQTDTDASDASARDLGSQDGSDGDAQATDTSTTDATDTTSSDTRSSDTGGDPDSGSADASSDWASCTQPSDCVLRFNTCCGVCGKPTLAAYDAVNINKVDEHRKAVCPQPTPCPACVTEPNNKLKATCSNGQCKKYKIK